MSTICRWVVDDGSFVRDLVQCLMVYRVELLIVYIVLLGLMMVGV